MRKKAISTAALAAIVGTCFQFGGCLGKILGSGVWVDLARSAIWEFTWDNDAILDLFGDQQPGAIQ